MAFLIQKVKAMTILAKYLNSGNRLTAFSLIEILTVLLIVGVILTIPNWPSLGTNLLNRIEGRVYATQAKIDLAILAQSRPSFQKFITIKLEPFCPSEVVQIHLGGLVKPVSIKCQGEIINIGALGEITRGKP